MAMRRTWTAAEDVTWALASARPAAAAAGAATPGMMSMTIDVEDHFATYWDPDNYPLESGYDGFQWSNLWAWGRHFEDFGNPGGHRTSGNNIMWFGTSAAISDNSNFNFRGVWIVSANAYIGQGLTVSGYDDGVLKYSQTFTDVGYNRANFLKLDFMGIDTVVFTGEYGNFWTLDDLRFDVVPGAIAGTLIGDANGNGVVDAGEVGLKGRVVILDDNGNGVVDEGERSTRTDADGAYQFNNVIQGAHTITQVFPDHWIGTAGGGAVTVGSDETTTAQLLTVNLRTITGDVAGALFRDFDANGVRDRGEDALSGWTVFADANSNGMRDAGEQFAVTDANGRYLLDAVRAGEVTIRAELPGGWEHWTGGAAETTVVAQSRTRGIELAVTGGATPGDDRIAAGRDSDDVIFALGGNDRVMAHNGNDRIDGGGGDDVLLGARGDDVLFGGAGHDRLVGGLGADVFVIDGAGRDRIFGLAAGDHIQVAAAGVDDFGDLTVTARGDGSVIGWAGVDLAVIVNGVAPDALDASMFVFG